MKFYTYVHVRLDNGVIFYIGKGTGKRAWSKTKRNKHWHNIVNKAGYEVKIVQENMTEREALNAEIFLIALHSRQGNLVNKTAGGEGISGYKHTDSAREKMSRWQIGRKLPDETKAKQALAARNISDETRAKRSLAAKRVNANPEHRAKLSAAATGKKHSPETRAKMSAAAKQRWEWKCGQA